MGKKVIFTEAQWNYILESKGLDPKMLDEVTCDSSVGGECSDGYMGFATPGGLVDKNDPSMKHKKKGGISCDRLDKNGKVPE